MSGKKIVSVVLAVSLIAVGVAMFINRKTETVDRVGGKAVAGGSFDEAIEAIEKVADEHAKISPKDVHTDILRVIASETETVCGITPKAAAEEVTRKLSLPVVEKPAELKTLPFDLIKIIARSPASLGGISPRQAVKEIIRRYLSLNIDDPDGINSVVLLEALQHRTEQGAVNKWADNEDAEALEKFVKEEADRDPSSVANFVYGLKHLAGEKDKALEYMNRFAKNANDSAFGGELDEQDYKKLIEEAKKLAK
ncbi:MAG: hypothetical protein LBF56_02075 [Holosporales bacterium]|jgi:hypothetical protein|nr:hypothetical protein [Holosporales bacterium]